MVNRKCWVDFCRNWVHSWGMCSSHRELWEEMVRIPRTRLINTSDLDRFNHYLVHNPSSRIQEIFGCKPDCWIWGGSLNPYGYGQFRSQWSRSEGGSLFVHLFSLVHLGGVERDFTHETDHICRFRPCANYTHLEQVSQKVNTLRGTGFSAQNSKKTHCPRGHEYTPENTLVNAKEWRKCRTCSYESNREWLEENRDDRNARRRETWDSKTGVRGKGQYQAARTECKEGHSLEGDNLLLEKRGEKQVRRCRACVNARARRNHAKRKAK